MQTETDPILEEVYRLRDEHAKRFNYDLDAIVADIQSRTKNSGRTFVTLDDSGRNIAKSKTASKTQVSNN